MSRTYRDSSCGEFVVITSAPGLAEPDRTATTAVPATARSIRPAMMSAAIVPYVISAVTRQRGGEQSGGRLVPGRPRRLGLRALGHVAVVPQEEAAHAVHAHLVRGAAISRSIGSTAANADIGRSLYDRSEASTTGTGTGSGC
ncbi:hypothetical protein [Streptomyces niveus]|uniref:hypothetical protein n=1 Tax=Streptomyces niveus TaxID=193462 RepID=UPI0035DD92D2